MNCPSCNKFAPLETQDPEDSLDVEMGSDNKSVLITGSVRVCRVSGCCGDEMKEYNFDVDEEAEVPDEIPEGADCDVSIEVVNIESTESGGGRYAKNMIGYTLDYKITVKWQVEGADDESCEIEGSVEDAAAASHFEELV